jgi:hypothetical protein
VSTAEHAASGTDNRISVTSSSEGIRRSTGSAATVPANTTTAPLASRSASGDQLKGLSFHLFGNGFDVNLTADVREVPGSTGDWHVE